MKIRHNLAFLAAFGVCATTTTLFAAPTAKKPAKGPAVKLKTAQLAPFIPAEIQTFRNPLKVDGADPWMTYYDGWYYLSTTTAVDVKLRRARKIGELKDAEDVVVWKDENPARSRDIWAPEFHLLDAKDGTGPRWYLYYTASAGPEPSHRMYVAQSAGKDLFGPYTFKSKLLTDAEDKEFAIDGSIIKTGDGRLFFVWCGRPSPHGQGLFISKMTNPSTLEGQRAALEADGFGAQYVREGPISLHHNGKIYLVYSANGASTPDYRLGALVADEKSDLTDPKSWTQYPKILFGRVDQNGVWGPGHNFFFKSPDGTEDWIIYHAKTSTKDTYADRTARAQAIHWRADGTPDFGIPISTDEDVPVPSGEK